VDSASPQPGTRVLIVDDNRDAADSLAYLLQLQRYDVRVAYDGPSGLRAAHEFAPDCLISDINMPGLDGYELARAVRAEPALANVKLVALSAFSGDDHARRAAEAGFDYRVTKAGEPQEILEVLRMIEQIKELATKTQELAKQNVELAGETKELLQEVKEEIKEVKEDVKQLKKEVKELKEEKEEKKDEGNG
jgi:CheY-like chemotaxis protein